MFVASLMAYDEPLYEDMSTNALMDSLDLFEKVINDIHFEQSHFVLVFCKKDRFGEAILQQDGCNQLNQIFNGKLDDAVYDLDQMCDIFDTGKQEEKLEANLNFIKDQYLKRNSTGKEIDVFYVCAYRDNNLDPLFNHCVKIASTYTYDN